MYFKRQRASIAVALFFYYFLLLCVVSYHKISSIEEPPDGHYLNNLNYDEIILRRSKGKNIFFIDPHPSVESIIDDPRMACGIESAGEFQTTENT